MLYILWFNFILKGLNFGLTAEYPTTLKQHLKIGGYVDTRILSHYVSTYPSIHIVTMYPCIHMVCDKRRLQTCRLAGKRGKPC